MVVKHTAYYALARGLPGLLAFAAVAAFTRLYSPEAYGYYVLVVGWVGLAHSVGFQWLRLGLVRFLPAYPGGDPTLRTTVAAAFGGAVGATGLAAGAALLVVPAEDRVWVGATTVLLWAFGWFDLNQNLAAGTQRPLRYGVLAAARASLFLVLGVAGAWAGWGGLGLLSAATVAYVVPAAWVSRAEWGGARRRYVDAAVLRRLFRYGAPLSATVGLTFVFSYSDRILIGGLVGVAEAGLYAAGYDLADQGLGLLTVVASTAAFPLVAGALEMGGVAAAREHLRQHVVVLVSLLAPAAVGLALLAREVSDVVLGPAFSGTAALVVPWVAGALLFGGVKNAYLDLAFQLGERTQRLVGVGVLAAALNVVLNLWLLPRHGVVGAAGATAVSYVVAAVASWVWGRSVFPLPFPARDLAGVLAATAAMGIALRALPLLPSWDGLLLKVAVGAAVYSGVYLALNVTGARSAVWRAVRERLRSG